MFMEAADIAATETSIPPAWAKTVASLTATNDVHISPTTGGADPGYYPVIGSQSRTYQTTS